MDPPSINNDSTENLIDPLSQRADVINGPSLDNFHHVLGTDLGDRISQMFDEEKERAQELGGDVMLNISGISQGVPLSASFRYGAPSTLTHVVSIIVINLYAVPFIQLRRIRIDSMSTTEEEDYESIRDTLQHGHIREWLTQLSTGPSTSSLVCPRPFSSMDHAMVAVPRLLQPPTIVETIGTSSDANECPAVADSVEASPFRSPCVEMGETQRTAEAVDQTSTSLTSSLLPTRTPSRQLENPFSRNSSLAGTLSQRRCGRLSLLSLHSFFLFSGRSIDTCQSATDVVRLHEQAARAVAAMASDPSSRRNHFLFDCAADSLLKHANATLHEYHGWSTVAATKEGEDEMESFYETHHDRSPAHRSSMVDAVHSTTSTSSPPSSTSSTFAATTRSTLSMEEELHFEAARAVASLVSAPHDETAQSAVRLVARRMLTLAHGRIHEAHGRQSAVSRTVPTLIHYEEEERSDYEEEDEERLEYDTADEDADWAPQTPSATELQQEEEDATIVHNESRSLQQPVPIESSEGPAYERVEEEEMDENRESSAMDDDKVETMRGHRLSDLSPNR
ncbi:hypothetical protein PRIPAC_71681, partial [Pristionchus pacificus]|uniref:Uncharacterized protein n=1 Tax=Pristionchus pacificus TaxID=54126 RepID=A0A2A6CG89_PRIPA